MKCTFSLAEKRLTPSAILDVIDIAAQRIWLHSAYLSSAGYWLISLYIFTTKVFAS
jgi:hypothetical protein